LNDRLRNVFPPEKVTLPFPVTEPPPAVFPEIWENISCGPEKRAWLATSVILLSSTYLFRCLGTSVLVAPLHVPFQLAKSLASLDAASGGRVVAGLGTGWSLDEYAAASVRPFEERGQVLDELIEVCRAVWGPDPVAYDGRLTKIASAVVGPKPARPIPILLPAMSKKAQRRLVDHADGWMPVGMGADTLAAQWKGLQELAAERGRTEPIQTVVRVNTRYSASGHSGADRAPFQGSVDQIVEDLVAHAEVGLDEILIELQSSVRDAQEFKEVAAEVYEKARAAGV